MGRGDGGKRSWSRRWQAGGWAVRALLSFGVFVVLAVPGTYAAWSDSVDAQGTITAGTVDLKVEGANAVSTFTAMNTSTLESGDSTAAVLTVTNSGTAPLNYYVDATASNGDGKGLGTTLVAKVTTDSSTTGSGSNVRCDGTALSTSGTAFTSNLVGTAASPRTLAGGASAKLCVQARMPEGTIAQGASTNIGLTFNAFTGTSANPGWTDTVPVSGITLGTVHAFYLGNVGTGNTTYAESNLILRRTGPTRTTLFNYDTNRDSQPGLVLLKGNGNPTKEWFTLSPALPSAITVSGTATLRIWSAVKDFNTTAVGSLDIELYNCDGSGNNCSTLYTGRHSPTGPWNSTGTWQQRSFTLVSGSVSIAAGRTLKLMISANNNSGDDMMLAYDTTTYRSALVIQ